MAEEKHGYPEPDLSKEDGRANPDLVESGSSTEMDAGLDKKLNHKFDRHIMPWLFGVW